MALRLERLELGGGLLTCVEKNEAGRCIRYLQTCDGDDCITEAPGHPTVPGRTKKTRKKTAKKPTKAAKAKKPADPAFAIKAPPNAKKWELDNPPIIVGSQSIPLKKGQRAYLTSLLTERKANSGTDFALVAGKPLEYPGLEMFDLFVHKSSGFVKISDARTGFNVASGLNLMEAKRKLQQLWTNMQADPEVFVTTYNNTRKIYEYPHIKSIYDSLQQTAQKKPGRASDPTSDEEGAAYLSAERDYMSGLAGDLLTCSRWIVVGKGANALIRCGTFKQTCQEGDPDCAEPGKPTTAKAKKVPVKAKKQPVTTKAPAVEPAEDIRNKIIRVVRDLKPETIKQLAKRFKLSKDEISTIVSSMADDNAVNIRMQRGASPLVVTPDYAAGLKDYEEKILRVVADTPGAGYGDVMHKLFLDEVFVKQAILDMESDKLVVVKRDRVGSMSIALTAKGKKQLVAPGVMPVTVAPEPMEPKVDRWMEEKPFTKDDTNRYNAFTFHPIEDLNNEFAGMMQPKLDEVDRLMTKFEVKEIPEEVQTGLTWYRRRVYEYLQRMIFSRTNAPGTFIAGRSNYNVKKHNKTIAGDIKYREALDVSGKKLDTAISKTITRRKTGRKAVAVSDREKWEATAVVTKRTKFGSLAEKDYIENLKKKPEAELTDWDKTLLNPKSTFRAEIRAEGRNLHARLIAEAFERGITIDPAVAAEYPDLARPKIDLTQDDAARSRTKWRKWEERKPPILLNPEHGIPDDRAYIVQDRSQRKSTEQGWDYSVVDAFTISFDAAKSIPMVIHKSTKVPSTFDISYIPTGGVIAAQSNPLDSKSKAVGRVRDWIAEDPDKFVSTIQERKERQIVDYPHLRDMYKNLNAAKANKRKPITVHQLKEADLEDLSGIGAVLQAANAVYSLARLAL